MIRAKPKLDPHPALLDSLDAPYGYTDDEPRGGHSLRPGDPIGQEEAKLTLVMCSACVNLLAAKAVSIGTLNVE